MAKISLSSVRVEDVTSDITIRLLLGDKVIFKLLFVPEQSGVSGIELQLGLLGRELLPHHS